jgi:F-type H+-transporting ATPase subunit delta
LLTTPLSQKEEVLLPGTSGYFGVKANHVPIIAQLKPGIVELHSGTDVDKYFISGGFAFVHPGGTTDICVLEAATLDQIDVTAVKQALAASQQDKGGDDYDEAVSRAAVEVYGALDAAMEGTK